MILILFELIESTDNPSNLFGIQLQTNTTTEQLPPTKKSHHYPVRNPTSTYVRSTISSFAKYKVEFSSSSKIEFSLIWFIILETISVNLTNLK